MSKKSTIPIPRKIDYTPILMKTIYVSIFILFHALGTQAHSEKSDKTQSIETLRGWRNAIISEVGEHKYSVSEIIETIISDFNSSSNFENQTLLISQSLKKIISSERKTSPDYIRNVKLNFAEECLTLLDQSTERNESPIDLLKSFSVEFIKNTRLKSSDFVDQRAYISKDKYLQANNDDTDPAALVDEKIIRLEIGLFN